MYEFPEEIWTNLTQVFQKIAAILLLFSDTKFHFISRNTLYFYLNLLRMKKNPFTWNRKKFIGRDLNLDLEGGNHVYLFMEILSPCAATNMSSNARWIVFQIKAFWGWNTVSMNYDFVLVSMVSDD